MHTLGFDEISHSNVFYWVP